MPVGTIAEVMENMSNGTYNLTDHGKCTGCGACCSNLLPMTEKEIREIKMFVKANNVKAVNHAVYLRNAQIDMTCPFMENSGNKRCRIYEVRPSICREFICDPKQRGMIFKRTEGQQYRNILIREEFFK